MAPQASPPRFMSRRDGWALAGLLLLATLGWEAWLRHHEAAEASALRAVARPGDIRMISSETCVFCARARSWLAQHDVPFQECFIEKDTQCEADYRALQSPGTPLMIVRGQRLLGFSPALVGQALQNAPS